MEQDGGRSLTSKRGGSIGLAGRPRSMDFVHSRRPKGRHEHRISPPPKLTSTVPTGLGDRVWWTLVGLLLIEWSIRIYGSVTAFPLIILAVVVLGAWGLATVGVSWLPEPKWSRHSTFATVWVWTTVLLVVAAFCIWSALQIHASPGYGTDEIAFDQYAAVLASHGLNPYMHSMAPSFSLYRVPPDSFTYSLTGHPVTQLSYPALAFELYMPLLKLGWSTQLAVIVNLAAWAATIIGLFVLLPKRLRPAALVIGSLSTYVAYTVGGVTDVLYVPFLMVAAYQFNRFPTRRGWQRYIGPVMFGLAMAIKQTPWFLFPFLVGAIWLEARAAKVERPVQQAAIYGATAITAFVVPNLPFAIWNVHAWVNGVLTPFTHVVPAGQGIVGLSLFTRLGGGSLSAYSFLTLVVFLALVGAYLATYPAMRALTFLLPSVILFFASRSFGSYMVELIPVAFVGAVTVHRQRGAEELRALPEWPKLVGVAGVLCLASLALALGSRQPLVVHVVGVRTTGQLATVEQLSLQVTNRSSGPLSPSFTIDEGGQLTTFWSAAAGPRTLAPHQQATYTLQSPNFFSQPGIGGGFQVLAFTAGPDTVSTSSPYVPTTLHIGLTPDAINQHVALGQSITIRADLYDEIDRRVAHAGVPIYLGQVIYGQQGLILSEASINGHAPGQTPVVAYTNRQGQATFRIVGTQATANPVYFEANLVNASQFFPYGYSEILPIRFATQ